MYTDNDRCVIDVGLAPDARSDVASFVQIAQAAHAIIENCVRVDNPIGGLAWNVGK